MVDALFTFTPPEGSQGVYGLTVTRYKEFFVISHQQDDGLWSNIFLPIPDGWELAAALLKTKD